MKRFKNIFLTVLGPVLLILIALWLFLSTNKSTPETKPVSLAKPEYSEDEAPDNQPENQEFIEVTKDNVHFVLETLSRPLFYYGKVSVVRYYSGHTGTEEISFYKNGDRMLFVSKNEGSPIKTSFIHDGIKQISYSDAPRNIFKTKAGEHDEDVCRGFMSYETLMSEDGADIIDACYEVYKNDYFSGKVISVVFTGKHLPYTYCCRISLDSGLPIMMECMENDEIIYTSTCTELTLSAPDESIFNDYTE